MHKADVLIDEAKGPLGSKCVEGQFVVQVASPESDHGEGKRIIERSVGLLVVGGRVEENDELWVIGVLLNRIDILPFQIAKTAHGFLELEVALKDLFQNANYCGILDVNNRREVNHAAPRNRIEPPILILDQITFKRQVYVQSNRQPG
jgi:hypothetical protein